MTSTLGVIERSAGASVASQDATPPAISISGVSKAYGHSGNAVVALDRLTLDVATRTILTRFHAPGDRAWNR